MKSEFESREAFECIFGDEGEIDLSKDETGEYSFQPTRFAYSFFLVAWQQRQTEVDELQKQLIEQVQRFNVQTQQIASLKWQLKRLGYTDNGGELMKPPIGDAPKFDLLDELQKRVDEQGLIIAKVMSIASDLQKSWEMFEIGKKLEQALKGGDE